MATWKSRLAASATAAAAPIEFADAAALDVQIDERFK
jgi:hypothetical protein